VLDQIGEMTSGPSPPSVVIGRPKALRRGYEAREARLWSPIHAATDAIVAFPVASALDLGAKLDHMETVGTFESYPDKYQQIVRDDVRRLSGGEA
jgi:hypothetical protein